MEGHEQAARARLDKPKRWRDEMSVLHFPRRLSVPRYPGPRLSSCRESVRRLEEGARIRCAPAGSAPDPELIAGLKEKLKQVEVSDLSGLFEDLGRDPCFMHQGAAIEDEALTAALLSVAERISQTNLRILELGLLSVEEYAMKHGALFFEGFLGLFIFFEDLGVGVLALADSDLFGPPMYAKFTRVEVAGMQEGEN